MEKIPRLITDNYSAVNGILYARLSVIRIKKKKSIKKTHLL